MKLNIIAIGKVKEKYLCDAVAEYAKRLGRYAEVCVIELSDAPPAKTANEQRQIEGERLLSKAKGFVIALDGEGTELSSESFASFLDKKCTEGECEFSFLIGGSHGHSIELKKRADMLFSFGKMTFPHQLFRVMLLEQLYRAQCILNGTPYHK